MPRENIKASAIIIQHHSKMCGLFTITPKALFKSSNSKPIPEYKDEADDAAETPPPYRHTTPPPYRQSPVCAKVNAIMGVPSSFRIEGSASIKEQNDKCHKDFLPEASSTGSAGTTVIKSSPILFDGHSKLVRKVSRNGSLKIPKNNAKIRAAAGGNPQRLRTRPSLYERKQHTSSPLANIVSSHSMSGGQHLEYNANNCTRQFEGQDPNKLDTPSPNINILDEGIDVIQFQPEDPPFSKPLYAVPMKFSPATRAALRV